MAEYGLSKITSELLRDRMVSRFGFLDYTDQQDGVHAGEFSFLEEFLSEEIIEDEEGSEQFWNSAPVIAHGWENDFGGIGGVSRLPAGSSPPLLTGGIPSTELENSPTSAWFEVREFFHGGYDGGIEVGFYGTWNTLKFFDSLEALERAKSSASEVEKGPEGFLLTIGGEEVLVMPTGGRAGGLLYKYRFMCRGVEFLIHSNPPQGRQPVRVCYRAESVQGGRDRFFNTHFEFVTPFLKRLGLVIHSDKLSRVDAQVMLDVDVKEIIRLCEDGHLTSKLRKCKGFFTRKRDLF
jgi:hypothetical protein